VFPIPTQALAQTWRFPYNTRLLLSAHASGASSLSFRASAHILVRSRNTNRYMQLA